jgi:hypothetical protein
MHIKWSIVLVFALNVRSVYNVLNKEVIMKQTVLLLTLMLFSTCAIAEKIPTIKVKTINRINVSYYQEFYSNFSYSCNKLYYFTKEALCCCDLTTNKESEIFKLDAFNFKLQVSGKTIKDFYQNRFFCLGRLAVDKKGEKIVFDAYLRTRGEDEDTWNPGYHSIFLYNLKTKELKEIIGPDDNWVLGWLYDDKRFLYLSDKDGLMMFNTNSGKSKVILNNRPGSPGVVAIQKYGSKITAPYLDHENPGLKVGTYSFGPIYDLLVIDINSGVSIKYINPLKKMKLDESQLDNNSLADYMLPGRDLVWGPDDKALFSITDQIRYLDYNNARSYVVSDITTTEAYISLFGADNKKNTHQTIKDAIWPVPNKIIFSRLNSIYEMTLDVPNTKWWQFWKLDNGKTDGGIVMNNLVKPTPTATIVPKIFGGPHTDIAGSLLKSSDGCYILSGLYGNWKPNVVVGLPYLIKIDANGDCVWSKTYNISKLHGLGNNLAISTNDNGYIMAGSAIHENFKGNKTYLIKVDSVGNELWRKVIGIDEDKEIVSTIVQTNENGYIMVGECLMYPDAGNAYSGVFVIKTDSDGNTLWVKRYFEKLVEERAGVWNSVKAKTIISCGNNYLIYAESEHIVKSQETTRENTVEKQPILFKIDPDGNTLWSKSIFDLGVTLVDFIRTNDNNYLAVGSIIKGTVPDRFTLEPRPNHHLYLIKIDPEGNTIWTCSYGNTANNFKCNSVAEAVDGFIGCGITSSLDKHWRDRTQYTFLFKVDSAGNSLWAKTVGPSNYANDSKILITNQGDLIVAGDAEVENPFYDTKTAGRDIFILKTDSQGNQLW